MVFTCRVGRRADHLLYSAGFAGAFIDREVETKGLDFVDKEKAKYEGKPALLDCSVFRP